MKTSSALLSSFIVLASLLTHTAQAASDSDFLVHETINITSTNSSEILDRVAANLDRLFQLYQPKVDSSTKIIQPLVVSGTALHPILKMTIQKCVTFICQTVEFEGVVSLDPEQGSCKRNYKLAVDLSQSSQELSSVYDGLDVAICYNPTATGAGTLVLDGSAHHAGGFQQGFIQGQIFNILKLQVAPITAAINAAIKADSAGQ